MEGVPDWPQPAESPAEEAARGTLLAASTRRSAGSALYCPGIGLAVGIGGRRPLGGAALGEGYSGSPAARSARSRRGRAGAAGPQHGRAAGGVRAGPAAVRPRGVAAGDRAARAAAEPRGGRPVRAGGAAGHPGGGRAALVSVGVLSKFLGLPRRLGGLIAVGTSICGVSAIVATAPAIKAEEDEVSYAVACVTLFGLVALFAYPSSPTRMFPAEPHLAGLFLGTAIHDTAQVAGAGLVYQEKFEAPDALEAATVAKLVRNLSMVAVIPLVVALYRDPSESRRGRGGCGWRRRYRCSCWHSWGRRRCERSATWGRSRSGCSTRRSGRSSCCRRTRRRGGACRRRWRRWGWGRGWAGWRLGWKAFCAGLVAAAAVGGVSAALISAGGGVVLLAPVGASDGSQGRKPLVARARESRSPGGATERRPRGAFCRPSGARGFLWRSCPGACAPGYRLTPLRG